MSTKKVRKESKFLKYIKGPVRVLARARDLYVRSLSGCAGHASVFGAAGGPQFPSMPRSFSASSSHSVYSSRDEDLRELIRVASTRSLAGDDRFRSRRPTSNGGAAAEIHRSRTVAIGRIDEDKACDFGGDSEVYYRSKSAAVRSS